MSKKVLIVDDEPDVVRFLTHLFEEAGFETATAKDGVEAFDALQKESPDLVTLDLQMPNDTGTDFYRRIHARPPYNKIPIIVISGLAGRHLSIRKPFAVFDKPIDEQALLEAARQAVGA
jgi:CheY-like chemotaxis protein